MTASKDFIQLVSSQNPKYQWYENTGKIFELTPDKLEESVDDTVLLNKNSRKLRVRKFVNGEVLESLKNKNPDYRVISRFFDPENPTLTVLPYGIELKINEQQYYGFNTENQIKATNHDQRNRYRPIELDITSLVISKQKPSRFNLEVHWHEYPPPTRIQPLYKRLQMCVFVAKIQPFESIEKSIKYANFTDRTAVFLNKVMNPSFTNIVNLTPTISLKCPITRKRLTTPVRFNDCSHLECFDLKGVLKMNSSGKFSCPICRKVTKSWYDLEIDQWIENCIDDTEEEVDCLEILNETGDYKIVKETANGSHDVIEILSDDEEPVLTKNYDFIDKTDKRVVIDKNSVVFTRIRSASISSSIAPDNDECENLSFVLSSPPLQKKSESSKLGTLLPPMPPIMKFCLPVPPPNLNFSLPLPMSLFQASNQFNKPARPQNLPRKRKLSEMVSSSHGSPKELN